MLFFTLVMCERFKRNLKTNNLPKSVFSQNIQILLMRFWPLAILHGLTAIPHQHKQTTSTKQVVNLSYQMFLKEKVDKIWVDLCNFRLIRGWRWRPPLLTGEPRPRLGNGQWIRWRGWCCGEQVIQTERFRPGDNASNLSARKTETETKTKKKKIFEWIKANYLLYHI